ncbi:hypothetical protein GOP47_0016786 [Adiantum capillus-veneris]|uniref:ADP-ribosylation factor n=1 Tax=Adiantum capillus-veneris TaxID=13818 RepID=A0A9D4ZDB1_ADICA|nr:hypothetical protein GOP47_0016786 [Adiantum capillus-veneris]
MGNSVGRLLEKLSCTHKEVRIVMLGLDAAGKTSIMYKLKLGEYVRSIPTIGFNIEKVEYKSILFTLWDAGGQEQIRHLWRHYIRAAQGVIFVVDSCDHERTEQAKEELTQVMANPDVAHMQVLVLANKHDLPHAMPLLETIDKLGLRSVKQKKWHIQTCSARTGEGLHQGLDWLASTLT